MAGRRLYPGAPDLPVAPTLVVIDVDGTILTSAHEVGAATAAQVRRVRRAGVEVLLASSRGPRAMLPVVTALGLTDGAEFVGTQGALTAGYDTAGALHVHDRRPAPVDAAHAVVAAATAAGLAVGWYAGDAGWSPTSTRRSRGRPGSSDDTPGGRRPDGADLRGRTSS